MEATSTCACGRRVYGEGELSWRGPRLPHRRTAPHGGLAATTHSPPCLRPRNLEAPSLARTRSLGVLGPTLHRQERASGNTSICQSNPRIASSPVVAAILLQGRRSVPGPLESERKGSLGSPGMKKKRLLCGWYRGAPGYRGCQSAHLMWTRPYARERLGSRATPACQG